MPHTFYTPYRTKGSLALPSLRGIKRVTKPMSLGDPQPPRIEGDRRIMPARPVAAARDMAKVMLTRYPKAYDSLRRPYAAARFWMRRPHDPDYGVFALFPECRGVFLDVGANAGMSALSFRIYNRTSPIVSIEPNPFHEDDLRFAGRLAKSLTYRMWAAGREDDTMELHVPVYRNVPLTTEASLLAQAVTDSPSLRARLGSRMDTDDFEIATCVVPVRPLDSLNLDPAFIKLDVQGFEHEALLGLEATLRRAHPVLLIETPGEEVRSFLSGLAYDAFTYLPRESRIVPETRCATNTVFVSSTNSGL
jgi:FkbM family methyltransferase